jgi:hypothetical protein
LGRWLGALRDTRDPNRITYATAFLAWEALAIFLLKLGSRRQVRFELAGPEALENLNRLSGCRQETLAHGDTLNHFLGHVAPAEWEGLRRRMVRRLIRMKALDAGRLFGHLLVAVDGTGLFHFPTRHCEHCLERTVNGQAHYFHPVLEAKLVTPEGLALSIGSEFIENAEAGASKQDCELKAFRRLAERLHADFPQLRLCLLLDALYANGPVFDLCRANRWDFIITFKEGGLPALWTEYEALREQLPGNRRIETPAEGVRQTFAWVEDLRYTDDEDRDHRLAAFECREEKGDATTRFAWLTSLPVEAGTVAALGNRGGRLRWKIENEGFNAQKNGGFALEHVYGAGDWQMKDYYLLVQIAHLIVQLVERGDLLGDRASRLFGSLRAFGRRLAESLRHHLIDAEALDVAAAARIQIRLSPS